MELKRRIRLSNHADFEHLPRGAQDHTGRAFIKPLR